MDKLDRVILAAGQRTPFFPIIVCFYTGITDPAHCTAMPRDPIPAKRIPFDESFPAVLLAALEQNPALHDGAVMIGRSTPSDPYQVTGWSYRLFPPQTLARGEINRGSAFNSCLAMSAVATVDRIYLISSTGALAFRNSSISRVSTP